MFRDQLKLLFSLFTGVAIVCGGAAQAEEVSGRYRCKLIDEVDVEGEDVKASVVENSVLVFQGERAGGAVGATGVMHIQAAFDGTRMAPTVVFITGYAVVNDDVLTVHGEGGHFFEKFSSSAVTADDFDGPQRFLMHGNSLVSVDDDTRCRKLESNEPLFEDALAEDGNALTTQ